MSILNDEIIICGHTDMVYFCLTCPRSIRENML